MSNEIITKALLDSAAIKQKLAETLADDISGAAEIVSSAIQKGNKVMFCGNGGSAADSQHLAAELVVRLTAKSDRKALAGIALTTDTSVLTAAANDFGYENVFSRQIEAIGSKGDILIAISTSGNSANVTKAVSAARNAGIATIGLLGGDGGRLRSLVDHPLIVPSNDTQRIQEAHITIGHIIISIVEQHLSK
jgi:D-sedoheptulose 7-phosphate isomerase